jgi:spore coat protein U-like protein
MKATNLLKSAALATALVAALSSAHAATTGPQNFNVTVNLTSSCSITAGVTDVAFTYTSFQAAAAVATPGAFSVRCTNSLPYTMALDAAGGSVIGLNYTVALSAASGTGSGAAQAYTVTGGMASGQSGTCATTTCAGTSVRTLTINY